MQCASKDVIEAAAALVEIAPLDAYRRLLARCVNGFAELNGVAELDDDLLAKFYGPPPEQPRFFTVERGGHDVAKLAAALGIDIVLLRRLAGERDGSLFQQKKLTSSSRAQARRGTRSTSTPGPTTSPSAAPPSPRCSWSCGTRTSCTALTPRRPSQASSTATSP